LPGGAHCDEVGCLIVNNHCIRTNHAEINALCQATRHGVTLTGAIAYVTNLPCTACAKALIAAGIRRVVVFTEYHDTLAETFFRESQVELVRLAMPELRIHYYVEEYSSARASAPPVHTGKPRRKPGNGGGAHAH
jgi:dCMP deaminase